MGKKVGMTQIFAEDGKIVPVTVVEAAPGVIVQIKTEANDGYNSIQLGFDPIKNANKPQKNHAAKADTAPARYLKEFRIADPKTTSWDRHSASSSSFPAIRWTSPASPRGRASPARSNGGVLPGPDGSWFEKSPPPGFRRRQRPRQGFKEKIPGPPWQQAGHHSKP